MEILAQAEPIVAPEIPWFLISPLLIIAIGAILLVTITSVAPRLRTGGFPAAYTILAAAFAAWFTRAIWRDPPIDAVSGLPSTRTWIIGDALVIDSFTLFLWGVICLSVFLSAAMFDGYLRRERFDGPDWYVLMLLSAAGGMLLAAAQDLLLIFLAIEILSIAVYVLAGLHLRRSESQEAGFKYFLLGALASAILLYGMALVYGATGTTNLVGILGARSDNAAGINPLEESSMILVGMAMLMVGFAFKVSAVPFHSWTPDVYQGAPTPVSGFMASAVKAAAFAGMFRVFWEGFGYYVADWRPVVSFLAILSLAVGSVLALAQTNVKRMLAYSSIVHAGFILVALYAVPGAGATGSRGSVLGIEAFLFYLLAYTLMSVGTFGVMTVVGGRGDDAHDLADYQGLARRQPLVAGLMAVLLFAQAGIPFTAGFVAKFRVIAAAADSGAWVLAGIAVLAGVVGAVLYLRIVVSMFMTEAPVVAVAHAIDDAAGPDVVVPEAEAHEARAGQERVSRPALAAIALAVFGTIALGVFPDWGSAVMRDAALVLSNIR